jgi:hypothetical protein
VSAVYIVGTFCGVYEIPSKAARSWDAAFVPKVTRRSILLYVASGFIYPERKI